MSKRQSTLLNYFQSPKTSKTPSDPIKQEVKTADSDEEIILPKKRSRIQIFDDSSDSDGGSQKPIKKQKPLDSSSSENENSTPNKPKTPGKQVTKSQQDISIKGKGKGKGKSVFSVKFPKHKPLNPAGSSTTGEPEEKSEEVVDIHSNWRHNKLDFLKPEKIKDANKRKPNHPEYDPKTLFVPEWFLKDLTPAMRQWWDLKSKHMDAVLFFKVGKFYELYHMDAVTGVTQLGFSYMKGDFAHSGFPETAYGKMASMLIERGYKVARCEQTETPEMMDNRCRSMAKPTKFDKVVRREICQVSAKGSTIYTAQLPDPQSAAPQYMYAINTQSLPGGAVKVGLCFVEISIGIFYLSEFNDDKYFSKLLSLLSEFPAALILTERNNKCLAYILKTYFAETRKENLLPKSQFYTASDTLEKLAAACYFQDKEGKFQWPEFFKEVADDCLPKKHCELALSSLGACLWYLTDAKIDIQVFSMGQFQWYDPIDLVSNTKKEDKDYLILDPIAILNLNLLATKDSLQYTLDYCSTAFGKRLLHRWICRPLCNVKKIKERQKAVTELLNNRHMLKRAQKLLKHIPDLERQLTKLHTYGNRFVAKNHPDSRAILYEELTYSKRKVTDFVKTIKAFEKLQEIQEIFEDCQEEGLLKHITHCEPNGLNLNLTDILDQIKASFDLNEVEKEGKIIPIRGVIEEYDAVEIAIEDIRCELSDYLAEQSKFFGCKLTYFGNERKRFQLEVPIDRADRATNQHQLEGVKKGKYAAKRFSTPRTRGLLTAMIKAENERAKVILDLNRRVFENFCEKNDLFNQVIQCTAILDALCALAEYARRYPYDICMPDVLPFSDKPHVIIENGRHPCIPNMDTFVPNDTVLGIENYPKLLILTGPNMGGKSTLMRQVVVISIMAQLGSFVPASRCELSLVDRVFTRLGANDDILHGHSTFYVELSEASNILQYGTKDSLVLIDELGRGTSTHDGNAIATAYVKKLATIGCRAMFSTHYHTLVDNFVGRNDIQLGHMACMVEHDDNPTLESVTFLYKMFQGRCPKSYGFNAARLAGMDKRVVQAGRKIAAGLETEMKLRDTFHTVFTSDNLSLIRKALASLDI